MGGVAALALAVVAATAPAGPVAPPVARPPAGAAAVAPPPALGPVAVAYAPPVDTPVAVGFAPPASPYGPGNRGVDYATAPGTPVRAAAGGQVTFAGRVGAGLHVVVLHADGIRTSYSFLATVVVRRGQAVEAGQTVGASGGSLHFGARAGDAYLDPLVLLAGAPGPTVHLVPDDGRAMGSERDERRGLVGLLGAVPGAVVRVGGAAVSWAAGTAASVVPVPSPARAQAWLSAVVPVAAPPWRLVTGAHGWWTSRATCTPASVAPPPAAARRKVVLVAGLGSSSGSGAVEDVDTAALGYAEGDVARFSYRGGTTDDRPYDADDTQVDIAESGRRLRDLLERLHAADPGVPIDVVAHSQGGLVARSALGARAPPGIESLVTLGTPHHGADLATLLALGRTTVKGTVVLEGLARMSGSGIRPGSTAVEQLAETSRFIRELNAGPLPEGVRVTSIAARADVVVPVPRARLEGATNVVVSVPDVNDHSALPGSDLAHREIALALARMAPTCEGALDFLADALTGEAVAAAEDVAGAAVVMALAR